MSSDIQNEWLQLMALSILREISFKIGTNGFFAVMADECTDISNKEQFAVCIQWVDHSFVDHEEVIGLYNVGTIDAAALTTAIRDVLVRMNLSMSKCRSQCYDGASNMTGSRNGVATKLQADEPRALLVHCYGHALNLAVGDAIKQSKVCRKSLETAFEVCKLIRFSPKRNAALDRIKCQDAFDGSETDTRSLGIRAFCPTRWTVRGEAIESIIENYKALEMLWEECLDSSSGSLDPEVKERIIGAQTQMQ